MILIPLLTEATLKGSLLILIAAAVTLGLYRSSAAVRHAVWTATIVGVLLLAPLTLVLPTLRVRSPEILAATLERFSRQTPPAQPVRTYTAEVAIPNTGAVQSAPLDAAPGSGLRSIGEPLALIWAAGTVVFSCWFLAAGLRLSKLARGCAAVTEPTIDRLARSAAQHLGVDPTRVRLRWSDRELTPMTWGLLHPVVLLPAACKTWDEERLRQVLVHEIGHIQRWDVLSQALSSAACALYWFNPLVGVAARQMLMERERACDDLVLESGAKPSSYAHELLEIARSLGARWTAARVSPAMARRSQISGRLLAVLDPGRSRRGLERRIALLTATATAAVILPLSALWPVASMRAAPAPQIQAAAADPSGIGPADFKAIAATLDEWEDAIRRRDAQAISMFYTSDGLIVTEGKPDTRGRQAVENLYRFYFDTGLAGGEIQQQEAFAVGDMICELGQAVATTKTGAVLSTSRYMTLWKRQAGKWRVHRDYLARQ